MPYICANVAKKMNLQEKESLKSAIGKIITALNKSEAHLMIDIEDGKTLFFKGLLQDNCAYIDVRVYGKCQQSAKEAFTKAVFEVFKEQLSIDRENLFLSILEYDSWGMNGGLI